MRSTTDLADVTGELVAREPLFHRREWGTTRADFERATSPDYWEVGASGARYDRETVWSVLAERYASGEPDAWESGTWSVSDVECRRLADEVYLLTYRLRQGDRPTRRATLWERHGGGWRAVYHQGTVET